MKKVLVASSVLLLIAALGPAVASSHAAPVQASPAACSTNQLRGSIGLQTGGAGSIFTTLVLQNRGSHACVLLGFPGVSLVDSHGRQIGRPATWDGGHPARRVIVQPGGYASTLVHTLNPGVGTTNCLGPSAALRMYPPNRRTALLVPVRLSECLGTLGVLPLVAGRQGE